jgi:CBS domain containing-hemolysin-like protein
MSCVICRGICQALKYLASLVPGSVFLGLLVYLYVVRQYDLIRHPLFFWLLVIVVVLFSMLFSVVEAALMTIDVKQHVTQLEQRTIGLMSQHLQSGHAQLSKEYLEQRHELVAEIKLVSEASERNAPIVVLNHLATILLGAVLPISLRVGSVAPVSVDMCSTLPWLGFDACPLPVPGTGRTESLTFFSVSLLLIVFGKIVPEKIGRKHNAWIIRHFRGLIDWIYVLAGWLVKPMLAIGDLFSWF